MRFIFKLNGKKRREHIMPYLKQLHFLPIRFRVKFKAALLVFKCLNNIAPTYLCDMVQARDIRRRSVRLDNDFYILKVPTPPNFSRTCAAFSYFGPSVWNELPYDIRSITELECFKKELKTFYFKIAFDD